MSIMNKYFYMKAQVLIMQEMKTIEFLFDILKKDESLNSLLEIH